MDKNNKQENNSTEENLVRLSKMGNIKSDFFKRFVFNHVKIKKKFKIAKNNKAILQQIGFYSKGKLDKNYLSKIFGRGLEFKDIELLKDEYGSNDKLLIFGNLDEFEITPENLGKFFSKSELKKMNSDGSNEDKVDLFCKLNNVHLTGDGSAVMKSNLRGDEAVDVLLDYFYEKADLPKLSNELKFKLITKTRDKFKHGHKYMTLSMFYPDKFPEDSENKEEIFETEELIQKFEKGELDNLEVSTKLELLIDVDCWMKPDIAKHFLSDKQLGDLRKVNSNLLFDDVVCAFFDSLSEKQVLGLPYDLRTKTLYKLYDNKALKFVLKAFPELPEMNFYKKMDLLLKIGTKDKMKFIEKTFSKHDLENLNSNQKEELERNSGILIKEILTHYQIPTNDVINSNLNSDDGKQKNNSKPEIGS